MKLQWLHSPLSSLHAEMVHLLYKNRAGRLSEEPSMAFVKMQLVGGNVHDNKRETEAEGGRGGGADDFHTIQTRRLHDGLR